MTGPGRELSLPDRIRYAPMLAQMVIIRRCNLRCGYCNEYDRVSPPVDEHLLLKRLDKLHSLGTFGVEFTGGEPLLHPALFRLLAHASGLGFITRWIITNAYLLREQTVAALNAARLTHMQISIDGVEPNHVTVKVLKPLRKKLEMLAANARFKVTISAVIGAAPPDEVWQVIRFAREQGFRPRVLLVHDGEGKLTLDDREKELFHELQRFLGRASKEAGNYRNRLITGAPAPFKCRAGARYLYIDEHGMVRWCSQKIGKFGKNLMDYTVEDLKEQFCTYKPCHPYCTLGCARTASKLDEWRGQPIGREAQVR